MESQHPARVLLWEKRKVGKNMWESRLQISEKEEWLVTIYDTVHAGEINVKETLRTIEETQKSLEAWRPKILRELIQLSREWKNFNERILEENLLVANVFLDSHFQLSAIYFNTPCFDGHQVIVEFNSEGEPYEAEITG